MELKYLAPYLPYGLQCMTKDKSGQIWTLGCENIQHAIQWWKPILKPMSEVSAVFDDFVNEMPFGDDYKSRLFFEEKPLTKMTDLFIIKSTVCVELSINKAQPLTSPYLAVKVLFENHYDVFGLIEQGLAIDANTLTI